MISGVDALSKDLIELGMLSDDDIWAILAPAGDYLAEKFRETIQRMFTQHSGVLAGAMKAFKRIDDIPYILVYPDGPHHKYRSRVHTTIHRRTHHRYVSGGGIKTATADEVGFVLEYGSAARGIAPSHWMENTIVENEIELGIKMQEGFDALCDEKGIGTDG